MASATTLAAKPFFVAPVLIIQPATPTTIAD